MATKAIFFVPVEKKYLSKWEYYQVDHDALALLFSEVIVCTSIWQVLKHLRGTDLVFCWWWHQSAPVVLLAKIFCIQVHVTGAIHMFDLSGVPDYYSKGMLYQWAAKIALALADRNLFISYDQFNQITSHLRVNNPVVVRSSLTKASNFSKNAILLEREKQRTMLDKHSKMKFLTVVWHRVDQYKRKGVFETLAALALLKQNTTVDFEWSVVGGADDGVDVLRAKIAELGLEQHVVVHTDVSAEDKRTRFLQSDLYIQPSWCEGFGNAVLEAMSHGLPVLVSRYTAQPEVVGQTGFVVMEMTPDSIYDQLDRFVHQTEAQKVQRVDDVLERVEKEFSFSRRYTSLAELYSSANVNFQAQVS